jgi:hypothetical protein
MAATTDIDNLLPVPAGDSTTKSTNQDWSLSLDADRTLTITRADGTILSTRPSNHPGRRPGDRKHHHVDNPSPPESSGGPDPRNTTTER